MTKRPASLKASTAIAAIFSCLSFPTLAQSQTEVAAPEQASDAPGGIQEIIVTAQKRSERINDVPMSITAATGEKLQTQGVTAPADLVRVVPGFQYSENFYNTPVFTIRGIGFSDNSAAARPTVSAYVDEVPLPFSILTQGVALDLERVEVLKGPQGTLFGSNSTGGALNFIAAKPTDHFTYGGDFTIGRFSQGSASGFVSGPLSDTLSVRVSAQQQFGDGWQKSTTRDDTLGKRDKTLGRIILSYKPTDRLRFMVNVNGFRDKSDVTAAQYVSTEQLVPGGSLPPILLNYPVTPGNNRAADWTPGLALHNNAEFYQLALRAEYDISDDVTITSISSYDNYRNHRISDPDGVSVRNNDYFIGSKIDTITQELRISGSSGGLKWIFGGNYQRDKVFEEANQNFSESSAVDVFSGFGLGQYLGLDTRFNQKFKSKAVFANLDYELSDQLTAHLGGRYTKNTGVARGCTADRGDGVYAAAVTIINNSVRDGLGLPPITIGAGECITAFAITPASIADGTAFAPGLAVNRIKEDNISWRAGLDWKPSSRFLVYGNVSKGYKAGSFPLFGPSIDTQAIPARQESVLAYELGMKATLLDRRVQLNAAVFHYDYKDKQFAGRVILDPNIFGAIESQINVPKSRVYGAELQLDVVPFDGLTLTNGVTYLNTKIKEFSNYSVFGVITDFAGQSFPTSPKWQIVSDAQYDWKLNDRLNAFVGVSGNYQSSTNGLFGNFPLFDIKSWATLDLRAGIEAADKSWKVSIFGRNVTDTYYYSSATKVLDTAIRFAGSPSTYGITVSFRGR